MQCWIDGVDTNETVAAWNSTEVLAAIPKTLEGKLHNCYLYNEYNETEKCSKWVFDTRYRTSSRAIEWSFVCDQRWMGAITQMVYMLGVFTGAVVLGGMADKYGRKTIFCWSGVLQLIFGVLAAFIPEYWSFLLTQYLYAIFGSADDRQLLQIVYGLHGLLLIPHIWIMDESPRWLWAQGRAKEAVDIIQRGLKCNKSEEILDKARLVSIGKVEKSKDEDDAPPATTLDLFKTPNLRIKTLNVCLCWFANSLVYYGLTLSTGKMEGNPYLITAIFGFVELPSYAAVIYFLDIWGRRPLISSMMLIGGAAC
ncbi:PREDICTED: organic cation transporter protein-like, partial [Papilio polytes]|uniref:organic cation transporter protein-like n=1 Tax=Papilio polytes TaxID=76194 RepID=UPI0006768945